MMLPQLITGDTNKRSEGTKHLTSNVADTYAKRVRGYIYFAFFSIAISKHIIAAKTVAKSASALTPS